MAEMILESMTWVSPGYDMKQRERNEPSESIGVFFTKLFEENDTELVQ